MLLDGLLELWEAVVWSVLVGDYQEGCCLIPGQQHTACGQWLVAFQGKDMWQVCTRLRLERQNRFVWRMMSLLNLHYLGTCFGISSSRFSQTLFKKSGTNLYSSITITLVWHSPRHHSSSGTLKFDNNRLYSHSATFFMLLLCVCMLPLVVGHVQPCLHVHVAVYITTHTLAILSEKYKLFKQGWSST